LDAITSLFFQEIHWTIPVFDGINFLTTMFLGSLAKKLYPRLQSGRAVYQLKMVLLAATVGLLLGGIIVTVMYFFESRVGK
jgi:ABC-type phosphate/phosphonate transport system permease subunit